MSLSNAYKIQNYIENSTNGFQLSDQKLSELGRFTDILGSLNIYPYIWYNAKYSSKSDSGTPANATSTTVFNLGSKTRDVFEFEKITGDLNTLYDSLNGVNGTASTATGLLDVSTIGADRPLFNFASSKTINTGQALAKGHITIAISLDLTTTTNQTLLTSANTAGLEITTDASSKVVFGIKDGFKVTFDTALNTDNKSIIISFDSFSGQAVLYIDGSQVSASDEQTLNALPALENLTIGSFDGLAQNIMLINNVLSWEQARDLAYLISYQHNILTMPIINLQPSLEPPFTAQTNETLAGDNDYPYNQSLADYRRYQVITQSFLEAGKLPELILDPDVVNYNLFTNTETLATQTVTLPLGTFTFYYESGTGSITSSDNTGVATGHGVVNTKDSTITITVTTAGTFDFTVSGTVSQASLVKTNSRQPYQLRTAVDVQGISVGSILGQKYTFEGTDSTPAEMINFDTAVSEQAFSFDRLKNQNLLPTGINSSADGFSFFAYVKSSDFSTLIPMLFSDDSGSGMFLRIGSSGQLIIGQQVGGSATLVFLNGAGNINTGAWSYIAVSYDNATQIANYCINGNTAQETGLTFSTIGSGAVNVGKSLLTVSAYNGQMGFVGYDRSGVYSQAQLASVYTNTKSYYGL